VNETDINYLRQRLQGRVYSLHLANINIRTTCTAYFILDKTLIVVMYYE